MYYDELSASARARVDELMGMKGTDWPQALRDFYTSYAQGHRITCGEDIVSVVVQWVSQGER
jgi:hypothetical protein